MMPSLSQAIYIFKNQYDLLERESIKEPAWLLPFPGEVH